MKHTRSILLPVWNPSLNQSHGLVVYAEKAIVYEAGAEERTGDPAFVENKNFVRDVITGEFKCYKSFRIGSAVSI